MNVNVWSSCCKHFLPSEDLLIRHAEFRLYNNPMIGAMASKFGNTYYHPRYYCVKKWPEFTLAQLCVPVEIIEHLTNCSQEFTYSRVWHQILTTYIHHAHILLLYTVGPPLSEHHFATIRTPLSEHHYLNTTTPHHFQLMCHLYYKNVQISKFVWISETHSLLYENCDQLL